MSVPQWDGHQSSPWKGSGSIPAWKPCRWRAGGSSKICLFHINISHSLSPSLSFKSQEIILKIYNLFFNLQVGERSFYFTSDGFTAGSLWPSSQEYTWEKSILLISVIKYFQIKTSLSLSCYKKVKMSTIYWLYHLFTNFLRGPILSQWQQILSSSEDYGHWNLEESQKIHPGADYRLTLPLALRSFLLSKPWGEHPRWARGIQKNCMIFSANYFSHRRQWWRSVHKDHTSRSPLNICG